MRQRAALGVLFFTVFVDLIGFGLVLPLLPFFATHFGASGLEVAALGSVFSLMQFLTSPYWGRLSDRYGRRPILLITLFGSTLSYLALPFCTTFGQIFASRAFAGFFGGNIAVANAYIADITTPETRSKGMGLIGAAFGLGFVFGPALGGTIAWAVELSHGTPERVYHVIGWIAGGICGLNALVAWWRLAESRRPDAAPMAGDMLSLHLDAWKRAFAERGAAWLILLYFALGFGFAAFESLFALLVKEPPLAYDVKHVNYFFLYVGLLTAAVQGGLIGRLVARYGERKLILAACGLFVASLGALPFALHPWSLLAALGALAVGQGLNRASVLGLLSARVTDEDQGAVLGVAQSAGSFARIVGPVSCGALFDHAGHAAPFLLSGGLVLAALAVGGCVLRESEGGAG
ncbi:MAG: MFS transporter [Verrucomicrobiae bacterium]|nr:MFS transporter [Verrucomicrobiae bacterium]